MPRFFFSRGLAAISTRGFSKSCFTNPLIGDLKQDGLPEYLWWKSSHVCLSSKSNTWILTFFLEYFFQKFIPLVGLFSNMPFFPQENKCKVLDFITHDLEGNQCEMMALICFHMVMGVAIRNMGMQPLKPMLMLIQVA
jgi:hypothetical protein